jgi:hypothetical protein
MLKTGLIVNKKRLAYVPRKAKTVVVVLGSTGVYADDVDTSGLSMGPITF